MANAQVKVPWARPWQAIALRVVSFLLVAIVIGGVLNRVAASMDQSARPAGFGRGVVQGALMPMSLPNLLAGRDITIYSAKNTGVGYKIGYTTGVNACGALFFGIVFWRFSRLRRPAFESKPADKD
jgi:uncharacterized membrane protein YraQ (UPF0718 family)